VAQWTITSSLVLRCHPSTPTDDVRSVTACATRAGASLALAFELVGDLARLRIPPPAPPCRGERLWEHTCFEAFVAVDGSRAYHELNLAPSRAWAVHAFTAYRDGGPLADDRRAPGIAVSRTRDRLVLEATVALDRLSPHLATAPLRVALTAIVEAEDGALSCWALDHPAGQPDFHHPDGFAVVLDPPEARAS